MHDVALRRMVILVIAAILSVTGASLTAAATETTNVATSVADAGLSELAPTANNGSATTLKVDGDDPVGKDLYAALRWDLSQTPAGATVTSATVTLNISNPSPQTYGAYELKRAWSEGQVNWNVAATGTPWATAGAKGATDLGSQIASLTPTNVAPYTFTIPASVVQGWLNDPLLKQRHPAGGPDQLRRVRLRHQGGGDCAEAHDQLHQQCGDGYHAP
jgi:hypothetical protein